MPNISDIIESIKNNPDPDAKVMWHLVQNGSDLSKPHEPDFAFSVTSEEEAQSICEVLSEMGFNVSIYSSDEEHTNFEVVGVAIMILELSVLNQLSTKFEEIAKQFNGEYLGWGAEVIN